MASSNSSKTAHVMNLLSKNRSTAASTESPAPKAEEQTAAPVSAPQATEEAPAPVEAAPAAPAAPVAPIISSITADAAVSSQIKDALEAELEGKPVVSEEPAPAPETPKEEEVPMDLPRTPDNAPPPEEHHGYINVMQILVEEKADEYMKMFGICCCDKCRLDVRAVALNHLPPKYVVLSENERVPRLTVYESRFASDVTAQLIQACKLVMLTPHHSRPED